MNVVKYLPLFSKSGFPALPLLHLPVDPCLINPHPFPALNRPQCPPSISVPSPPTHLHLHPLPPPPPQQTVVHRQSPISPRTGGPSPRALCEVTPIPSLIAPVSADPTHSRRQPHPGRQPCLAQVPCTPDRSRAHGPLPPRVTLQFPRDAGRPHQWLLSAAGACLLRPGGQRNSPCARGNRRTTSVLG